MEAGCYTLDLYCDIEQPIAYLMDYEACPYGYHKHNEFPHQFTAELGSDCRRQARQKGWVFKHNGSRICPRCAKRNELVTQVPA